MQKAQSVAIIGASSFDADDLYSLLIGEAVDELILVDSDALLLEKLNDLLISVPIAREVKIREGNRSDAALAAVVVLANAIPTLPNETRRQNFFRNALQVHRTAEELRINGFRSVLIVAIEPVDLLAKVALNASRIPARQVIGSGRSAAEFLDSGEAVLSPNAVWCAARKSSVSSIENCDPNCPGFGEMLMEDKRKPVAITRETIFGQLFSVGTCIPVICRSVLRKERTILPVSAYLTGQYGISNVFLNQPCVISGGGVEKIIELKIDPAEKLALGSTAERLRSLEDEIYRSSGMKNSEENNEDITLYRRVGT